VRLNVRLVLGHQVDEPLVALAFSAWISHEVIIVIFDDDVNFNCSSNAGFW
jgi:hypothetical protein